MKPLDPRLLRYARATRAYLAFTVALGVALAALVVAQATLLAHAVTAVFLTGADVAALVPVLAWLVVVFAARAAVAWAQEGAAVRAAAAAKGQLRVRLVTATATAGPDAGSGATAVLATRGLDALDAYFSRYLPQLVLAALIPVIVLARILPADAVAAGTIALTLPLIPLFMALVGLHTEAVNRRQFRYLRRMSHHFLDVVAGLPTLKTFGRAKNQVTTIRQVGAEHRRLTMRTLRTAFLSALVLELFATLSVALVAVGIGLRLVSGQLDLATALLVLILAPEAYLPLRQVGANYHASAEGLAAAEEAFAVIEAAGDAALPSGGAPAPDPSTVDIRFAGVRVDYPGRNGPALALTARVRPGEVVALTGPSGCGKSTAFALLLGMVRPAEGEVLVGGTALSTLDMDAWRRRIAWMPQRPWLFAGTVADNIRLGDAGADETAVRRAARAAGAERFIDALPDGFDTRLGDDGAGVSTGQRQRIALARVFLRDAPLVLLDEPTANLDSGTAAEVTAAIRRLAADRTVILAAHRPELVAVADREIRLATAPAAGVTS
jgi:ATP-binding cassette subfamily C protein CydD/ATP-binding cassette subfamily C protein CydCD